MASEELQGIDLTQAPLAPVQAPIPLPPYPEMIMAAIEALNEESGSNKSSISRHIAKHIEATYGPIPPAHSALLSYHLSKMKSSGQLQFFKNNYLIPDPNSPPRRGRGRPPKPKEHLTTGEAPPAPPRPRGRPPKSHDPSAPPPPPKPKAASAAPPLSGRTRGRPPKPKAASAAPPLPGRKRGRPPKPKAEGGTATSVPPSTTATGGVPRGRGRPPKVKPVETASVGA